MHNAYYSSTLLSVKSRGSLSFSFNDYPSLLNEGFERTPLSCCSCCCACCSCCEVAARNNRVPINTSYLYGLRQSTLIQCSPYKRLILAGKDRFLSRSPVYDLDRGSYEVSCSIKQRNGNDGFGRRRKGRFRCMVSEEKSERYWLGGVADAEAVISLLSEEVSEEYLGGRKRNERLAKRVEVEKNEDHGAKFYRSKKNKVEVEKKGRYGGEYSSGAKKTVGSNLLDTDLKCEFESGTTKFREEVYKRNEGREAIARGENQRERTKTSSCSSYYSFSSVEEYGSDEELQDKQEQFVEESLSGFRKDSGRSKDDSYKAQVGEEFNRCNIEVDLRDEVPEQRYTAAGSHVEWDCRKKSEKKLTEVSVEETNYRKQSSQVHLRTDRRAKTDYGKASSSHKQFNDAEEKSTLAVNLDKGTTKLYSQMGIQDTDQSRSKWQEVTEIEEMHGRNVETTSESQKQFNNREEKRTRGERFQTVGVIAGNNDSRRNTQQLTKTSEILDVDTRKVTNLQRHSESRMKVQKEDETLVQSSVQHTKGQHKQRSERIAEKIDLRREPEYFSEISETHDNKLKRNNTVQSDTRMKNQDKNSKLVSISYPEAKEQQFQRDYEHHQRTQSQKGSQDVSRASVVHAIDVETHNKSLRTSSERVINQESTLTSVVKPAQETRERHNQPDERVMEIELRKEAQKPTRLSSSHEQSSEESSSLQASIDLVSQARVQQIHVEEEERISQEILMPPPSQLVARGSPHIGSTSDIAIQEVSSKSSEGGSSAWYTNSGGRTPASHNESYIRGSQGETYDELLMTHGDSLGSAHRLEESAQFVGEFVEKARHEVSTSEMQKENVAETKVVYEGEEKRKKASGQDASVDFQLKEHESRRSSEGSGAKGPSDEMWDVTDPFVQPSQARPLEGHQAAGNVIVKRRGRSFWNIMADIVRLRWSSHAETSNSATRPDAKSPSNESVTSETWFSGRESDKNSDENMKKERRSMPQDATPFHQLQQEKTSTHMQVETSDTMRSENKERKLEADMPYSSSLIESGSKSERISTSFEEKNLEQRADGGSFQSSVSGMEVVPSSLQLPAGSTRSPPAEEATSETGKIHVSESGSMVQLAQPFNSRLTQVLGSPGKDRELKQRKLQRNNQVLNERFEEWEEAYRIENEQQKIDEMFMREALLEAKKAADTWEVPVGAVLVQRGKIIARGCNL